MSSFLQVFLASRRPGPFAAQLCAEAKVRVGTHGLELRRSRPVRVWGPIALRPGTSAGFPKRAKPRREAPRGAPPLRLDLLSGSGYGAGGATEPYATANPWEV